MFGSFKTLWFSKNVHKFEIIAENSKKIFVDSKSSYETNNVHKFKKNICELIFFLEIQKIIMKFNKFSWVWKVLNSFKKVFESLKNSCDFGDVQEFENIIQKNFLD